MKLICTMPARNEDWILGLSARAVLEWVDELVILDHASTDGTIHICRDLISVYLDRVQYLNEPDPQWNEREHRQRLLEFARSRGATHIVMVDADEVLTGDLLPKIRELITGMPNVVTLQIPWLAMWGAIDHVVTRGLWAEQDVSVAFRDEPRCHWKRDADGNDFHHRHPMGRPNIAYRPVRQRTSGLMHLQFASQRRLKAKQFHYQLIERLRWPDRETPNQVRQRYSYAVYGDHRDTGIPMMTADVPAQWWAPYKQWMQYLNVDGVPWQEAEIIRIIGENPGIERGLDDFGVLKMLKGDTIGA